MKTNFFKDKQFFKLAFALAIPIMIQNLINSSINMLDTFMIGRLGEAEVTAVGLANQIFFLYSLLVFGINSGMSIFMAQYYGKGDIKSLHKVEGICLLSSILAGFVFMIAALFIPETLMKMYSKDSKVIELGVQYLKIIAFSYILTAISYSYTSACKSSGQTKLPMYSTAISLICNATLNAVLIFGYLGFPKLGVRGAAIATLISRCVEALVVILVIYLCRFPVAANLKSLFGFKLDFFTNVYKTAIFVVLNEFIWALGTSIYNIAYKYAGTQAQAAIQISGNIQNLFTVVGFGMGSACAISVGNLLGANDEKKAIDYSNRFAILSPFIGLFMGIILIIFTPSIMTLFNVSDEVVMYTKLINVVIGLYFPFKMLNYTIIVGILRCGGDTTYGFILDFCGVWFIGVPMAFIGICLFNLPIYIVIIMVTSEEFFKAIFGLKRLKSKKWVNNVVNT